MVVVWTNVLGVHTGYLWQFWQTVEYFCVFAVCVTGLFERWHTEQFVVTPVCE